MENNEKKSFFSGVVDFFKKKKDSAFAKSKYYLVIVLVIAIIIIFVSSFFSSGSSSDKSTKVESSNLSAMEYCETVENRLVSVLENVKGIGKVQVFVMVDSSPTIKYLEETEKVTNENQTNSLTTQEIKTTIVMSKNGNVTYPVVVVEMMPKITGVLVVATGAKDLKMKTTLINVVSSILSVDVSSVEVLEGKA